MSPSRYTIRILAMCLFFLLTHNAPPGATPLAHADDLRMTPVVRAVQRVGPAVVNITTDRITAQQRNPFADDEVFGPFFREFFGELPNMPRRQQSLGSGVIINGERGLVLSNAHVIAGAQSIAARLIDGREFEAELVGSDPDFDLAVLRLKNARNLPEVPLGDSSELLIGETVIAIGNPFGFTHTVTTGVVSAVKRSIRTERAVFTDFIQTDAAINPGNSGGPLLNIHGEVIGVTTAIHARAEGIGFAIPIDKAKRVLGELLGRGRVSPVWLGLYGQSLDPETAAYFGLQDMRGMLVTESRQGLPAANAGVTPGDVVLELNGVRVEDKEHYLQLMRNFVQGERVRLTLLRQGRTVRVETTLAPLMLEQALQLAAERWGMHVRDAASDGAPGLLVTAVIRNSPAARLGVRRGDVLLGVGGLRLDSLEHFAQAYRLHRLNNTLLMLVGRGGRTYHVRMRL